MAVAAREETRQSEGVDEILRDSAVPKQRKRIQVITDCIVVIEPLRPGPGVVRDVPVYIGDVRGPETLIESETLRV